MMTRRITFRLYPSKPQTAKLFEARRLHAYLYNACVEHRKTSYKRFGKSISYLTQQAALVPFKSEWEEYRALNHGSLQATVKRVDFAFQRFFKGIGGHPKFQSIRKYSGWTYPDARQGFKVHSVGVNGYLELRDLGFQLQMRGKARTWGTPTTCTIVYRNGKWFASITVSCEPVRESNTGAIGIDFGVLTAAALSDGTKVENQKFLAKSQAKVRLASKAKRRKRSPNFKKKIKGSKRWRKAAKKVAKLQLMVANQRQDWTHKVAAQIVSSNSMVATEKLNLKGMTAKAKSGKRKRQKTGLTRSILDVGMGMLRSAIEYKLTESGGVFIEVPTVAVKPSQTCPRCGHQEKKTLEQRVHDCPKCGLVEDRDVAAAQIMLNWASGKFVGKVSFLQSFGGSSANSERRSPPHRSLQERATAQTLRFHKTFQEKGLGTSLSNADESSSTLIPKERKNCGGMKQLAQTKRQKRLSVNAGVGNSDLSASGSE